MPLPGTMFAQSSEEQTLPSSFKRKNASHPAQGPTRQPNSSRNLAVVLLGSDPRNDQNEQLISKEELGAIERGTEGCLPPRR